MHSFKSPDDIAASLRELADLGVEIHTADWKQICVMCSSGAREIERLRARIISLEVEIEALRAALKQRDEALRPFAEAYRYTQTMGAFMREQFLSSMTVSKKATAQDFARAAELVPEEKT